MRVPLLALLCTSLAVAIASAQFADVEVTIEPEQLISVEQPEIPDEGL